MHRLSGFRAPRAALVVVLGLLIAAVCASGVFAAPAHTVSASGSVSVSATPTGPAVPTGFLGISMEYKSLEPYFGSNPGALDAPFVQLLRNLSPAGGSVLRIGGDSSDWSWWPVPGVTPPGGIKYGVGPVWAAVAKSAAAALHGRLILGINLEADSAKIASYEETQLLSHIGLADIDAFELGNEPELYASFSWFKNSAGVHVDGRAPGYDVSDYFSDFSRIAAALPKAPLAGPSSGSANWLASLGSFVTRETRVSLLTVHAYPTKHCEADTVITAADLFEPASLQGLAGEIAAWVATATAHRLPLRVDEMNSVSCGGERGLSNSFAPALWAIEILPKLVATGVAGVNFHTIPGSINAILTAAHTSSGWRVSTQPEYLGMVAFTDAAPPGSRLLGVSAPSIPGIDEWATVANSGAIHVVLVNASSTARALAVRVSGAPAGTSASVMRLEAPSLAATSGVTLGGQTVSPSTGTLSGKPATITVTASSSGFNVTAPPTSATILTISRG